ncbi:MAG: hypothetical protein U0401_26795 [Anaerolineae bacterium]
MLKFIRLLIPLMSAIAALACGLNSPWLPLGSVGQSPLATPTPLALEAGFIRSGLNRLQSYRASIIVEFEGMRNRQPVQGRIESLIETTRQPEALHQYLKVQTSLTDTQVITGVSEFYRVGAEVLVKKGDRGEWFRFTDAAASPEQMGFVAPERLMTLPPALKQAPQPEILNGQPVQRYSFTAAELSDPNLSFETAQGELWLAQPSQYLAQYVLSATLRVIIPDPTAHFFDQGRLNLRYTVSDVNEAFEIQPPRNVLTQSNSLGRLPRLPDAAMVSVFPTFIEYTSATSPLSATLFYRDELPKLGWTEVISQSEVFKEKARLNFAKAGQNLTILITPAEEKDRTKILLQTPE